MKLIYVKIFCGGLGITLLSLAFVLGSQQDKVPQLLNSLILEKTIEQVENNLSGLTWDTSTNTLLAVTNRPAQIIQLDKRGNVITLFPLPDIDDTESISLGWVNNYLIAEERLRKITPMTLSLSDSRYQIQSPALELDVGGKKNNELEGVAFSKASGMLFVANEKCNGQLKPDTDLGTLL
ncbi:hypothetical protein EYY95_06340 [Hafnia alvei]|uniref:SdiA-regulated domain-containing protein n=1 Tax=Hafnia alvei TaxID=569 RepID=UPI001034F53A|nr:SdiA-regulated domain-containing protein [Hafnia alvei]TBL89852.1 hypothetical protein EYY95_06340 [Hafnia alvei]